MSNLIINTSTARSADWIKTEYNNQNAPGNIGTPGFYTVGSESGGGGGSSNRGGVKVR